MIQAGCSTRLTFARIPLPNNQTQSLLAIHNSLMSTSDRVCCHHIAEGSQSLQAKDFERLLLDSIDEALSTAEEKKYRETYAQLESFGVSRVEIPKQIGVFTRVIDRVFEATADDIESLILKRLHEKNGWRFKKISFEDMKFEDQVERVCGKMYSETISNMQSPVAVFHIEDLRTPSAPKLIAINSNAAKTTMVNPETSIGKTIREVYPEISFTEAERIIVEVARSERPKSLGSLRHHDEFGHENILLVTAFPFSSNCIGLVFKQNSEQRIEAKPRQAERLEENSGMGEWRWELDTLGRQVTADRSRIEERWIRKEVPIEPQRADYFSVRGKEYLESGDLQKAREFFLKAEEMHQRSSERLDAFENASLRIKTYSFEEKIGLEEYFPTVEEYLHKYPDFFMDEKFIENLANYLQWKGYKHEEEQKFGEAQASYSEAEEMFLALKQSNRAVFNASRFVLILAKEESIEEYIRSAEEFFHKHSEFSGNKYYKEVRAQYCSYKAEKTSDSSQIVMFRSEAERLFLQINQREKAYENACKLLDVYWEDATPKDSDLLQKRLDETEEFFEKYKDFAESEYYRKRVSEYYLLQARTLASQLREAFS